MDIRFGTWNVRSLYKADSLITVVKLMYKCKLDLLRAQLRWESGGRESVGEYKFFHGKGNVIHELGTGRRMSYIILRDR
jgi:hypothetical protein